jgi:hypothetical protein
MRPPLAAGLLLLLAAAPAAAQDAPPTERVEETDAEVLKVRDSLKSDPAFAETFVERLLRSRLIGELTSEPGEKARAAAAREWIKSDPDAAAHVAIGLAGDDVTKTTAYEDSLLELHGSNYTTTHPGDGKNSFNRLRTSAGDSKLLKAQSDKMSDDEKREILRTIFEGQGGASGRTIETPDGLGGRGGPPGGAGGAGSGPAAATAYSGYYDRLGAGNLHGYSPQLVALQSALNLRRPPGAPALVETGKLDEATLSYPAYGMSYDINNLESRLRRERLYELARAAGRTLSARDEKDPDLEAKLAAQVPAVRLPPRLAKRAELESKARAALSKFSATAASARDPKAITRGLLVELGREQRETARWIAAAALEEELSRVDELTGFLTPELLAAIDAVPVAQPEREAYKRAGGALQERVARVKANAEKALALLESDAWTGALAEVDALVSANAGLKRTLAPEVDAYRRAPYRVAESRVTQARWRAWLDDAAVKWAPSLEYSRGVAARRARLSRALEIFGLIASGDANGARAAARDDGAGS